MNHSPFSIEFKTGVAPEKLEQDDHVLAAISFSSKTERLSNTKPIFSIALNDLEDASMVEVWKSAEPVQTKNDGNLTLSWNSEILFGFIQVNEDDYDNLIEATQAAYHKILSTLNSYEESSADNPPHSKLLRIWNYFSSINDDSSGLERYRAFCLGRQNALDKFGNFPYAPPAATAIGARTGDLQIYFIAAREAGMQLENPRQTSAFLYPREYGEVSPAFSRATLKIWKNKKDHLYISGTTSIVGSKSQHFGDVPQQIKETLENVETLINHGYETLGSSIQRLDEISHLKVYLRDASLLAIVKPALEKRFSNSSSLTILYLQGDVCRADLLVEVEAAFIA